MSPTAYILIPSGSAAGIWQPWPSVLAETSAADAGRARREPQVQAAGPERWAALTPRKSGRRNSHLRARGGPEREGSGSLGRSSSGAGALCCRVIGSRSTNCRGRSIPMSGITALLSSVPKSRPPETSDRLQRNVIVGTEMSRISSGPTMIRTSRSIE